ncbi:MAG: hypothetical protein CMQ22_02840 [Gammaproteobacteria bacterium]|nr:hypothetical protein [Gammaproteobacteria bacterium]
MGDMKSFKVLIIGGTGAIGGELIRCYQEWSLSSGVPLDLYATCRHRSSSAQSGVTWLTMDLRRPETIFAAVKKLTSLTTMLNHWVCCTGYLHGAFGSPEKALKALESEKILGDFAVNSVGPLMMFQACMSILKAAPLPKAVFLSAQVGSIEDNRSGGWYGYRMSKAALNMGVRCAAVECGRWRHPPAVVVVHPGTTVSRLSEPFTAHRHPAPQTAEQCAEQLFLRIQSLGVQETGTFQRLDGSVIPW